MNKLIFASILCLFCCSCDKVDSATSWISESVSSIQGFFNDKDGKLVLDTIKKDNDIQFSEKAKASKLMDERRIYLVDLTRSMEGFNGAENIFDAVKNQLRTALSAIKDTSTEILIIPFANVPMDLYRCKISQKDSLLNYISNLTTRPGDTNIFDAWNKGVGMLDPTKINYMFMLTDGVHNCGVPIDSLYKSLNNWHNMAQGKYQFAFYVLLSENAREKEICRIVDSSKQMWLVPSMNINTDFIIGNMNLSVNIINTSKAKMHLSCTNPNIFNQGFRFKISIPENDCYRIINASEAIDSDGDVTFEIQKLKPQKELPISFKTKILIDYDKQKFPLVFFTPEEYNIHIANVGTRIMNIKKLDK